MSHVRRAKNCHQCVRTIFAEYLDESILPVETTRLRGHRSNMPDLNVSIEPSVVWLKARSTV